MLFLESDNTNILLVEMEPSLSIKEVLLHNSICKLWF